MSAGLTYPESGCTGTDMTYAVCITCTRTHIAANRPVVLMDGGYETACPYCGDLWHREYATTRTVRVVHRDDGTRLECVELHTKHETEAVSHG
jgi:DNA-directed RNA polymerase subunit RPC12/RpoP